MSEQAVHIRRLAGLEMIIAIDSTLRGPALGGCRWRPYPDSLVARREACALAAAMTRKAALARLSLGGGKAVVIGDPAQRTREQLFAFGDFVESLGGCYITAADMGTGEEQMAEIRQRTRFVVGLPRELGGCGDPGPFTARGVYMAIVAALGGSVTGARVAVQGVGSVGGALVRLLLESGASIIASDPDPAVLEELPDAVRVVDPHTIVTVPCEVLAPCGPSGVLDAKLAREVRCQVVCGAANNPLTDPGAAAVLHSRGVLYVPDFLANAGGLIHLAVALEGGDELATFEHLRVIPDNLEQVLARVKSGGGDTLSSAEELARDLLAGGERS
ncbi:MAG: Glu/Leu/Phe/Val dehydrogenase dimerization domain-containing protein [Myxococcota bacterium]